MHTRLRKAWALVGIAALAAVSGLATQPALVNRALADPAPANPVQAADLGQADPEQPEGLAEVVVTARAPQTGVAGFPALDQVSAAEIASYGADTLADLLNSLQPLTLSSHGDKKPLILINGHLAGTTELGNLPPEAIERIDILPEEAALAYGFSDQQRVVNVILKRHFRSLAGHLGDRWSTEGEGEAANADSSFTRVSGDSRGTVRLDFTDTQPLLASERDIPVADSAYRSLIPESTAGRVGATLAGALLGASGSAEASVGVRSSRSLQGLAELSIGDAEDPLRQTNSAVTPHISTQLTGPLGRLTWLVTAAYDGNRSHSLSDTGVATGGLLESQQVDSTSASESVGASLSGPVAALPAGRVYANLHLGAALQSVTTQTVSAGSPDFQHSSYSSQAADFNATVPLTSRRENTVPVLGDTALNLGASVQQSADFGTLTSLRYGLSLRPTKVLSLDAALAQSQTAPSVQQLFAPTIVTPNVEMFDFVTGQTVYVTELNGGNSELRRGDTRSMNAGFSIGPFAHGLRLTASYQETQATNSVGSLPPLTAAVEAAFPDSFIRDTSGALTEVNNTPVNLALQTADDLHGGLYWSLGRGPEDEAANALHAHVSLADTWYLRDTLLIRAGIPELDLLSQSSGQPHNRIEFESGLSRRGWGAQLSAAWHSAVIVNNGNSAADVLYFSSLTTGNLRVFADLGQTSATRNLRWAEGFRVSLSVTNAADSHPTVLNGAGVTPTAFLPGYLDPLGRVVSLSVRKII